MKKFFILSTLLVGFCCVQAQVGINTENPDSSAALDINATDKGLLIPRVALKNNNIELKTGVPNAKSLMVFNTDSTNIEEGLYIWMDTKWEKLAVEKSKFEYLPSVALPVGPTDPLLSDPDKNYDTGTGIYTVNIYNIFKNQFNTPIYASDNANGTQSVSSLAPLVKQTATEYTYYITYADPDLFVDPQIDSAGILTYTINNTAIIRANSFMNIVVKY